MESLTTSIQTCKTFSCGMQDLVPQQGTEPGPPQWEHGVLASGLPGKSPLLYFKSMLFTFFLLLLTVTKSCPTLCDPMDTLGSFSFTISWSLLKFISIELVMLFHHLVLCNPSSFCLPSFPASGSFLVSQFFASCGLSIGASVSASVFPMNIHG